MCRRHRSSIINCFRLLQNKYGIFKKTRRMAIANGTCVSFCNQPKAHYLATSRESRRYVIVGASIWLCQESLRHILASPGYVPGTVVINFTWMEREFNACQTHRSMHPSIFNRFPVIWTGKFKKSPFYHFFLHILASPGYDPGTIAVNVTWIEREFNACQRLAACTHLSSTISEI